MNEKKLLELEIAKCRARLRELRAERETVFSRNLRTARRKLGLTQKQVADKLGMTQGAYTQYETGRREPSMQNLVALADLLNVSLDWLCGRVTT